jgi:hypothetical protein
LHEGYENSMCRVQSHDDDDCCCGHYQICKPNTVVSIPAVDITALHRLQTES